MTQLTAELIRQHPALAAFNEYIEQNLHRAPIPQDIIVHNDIPNDGILRFSYLDSQTNTAFVAQLSANVPTGALEVNHGPVRRTSVTRPDGRRVTEERAQYVHRRAVSINTTGVCDTIHAIGGEEESGYTCPATSNPGAPPQSLFAQRAAWFGQWGLANWVGLEFLGLKWKRLSIIRSVLPNLPRWFTATGTNELSLGARARFWSPVLAAGAVTALSAEHGADMMGLHSNYHSNERFALDVYGAYGMMHGVSRLINRRNPGAALRPAGLGAGLLTSALVDATLGQMYAEGSAERRALRVGGFFLPEVYRMAFGNRALAVAETRAATGFARWGGRAMAAGFYADGAHMIWNHFTRSNAETGRDNLIYRRANQLEDAQRHPLVWALHGAAELIAPSLTERYWVSGSYVDQARQEIQAQAAATGEGARSLLRHSLLLGPTGPATDASFYRELNFDWLRGENVLRNIRRPDGSELPVADVAEQFADPAIYERVIVNGTPDPQVAYIQRQFRGYNLSVADVQEILARISLHHARSSLQDLQYTAGPELRAFADCFDGSGALRAGSESALLAQVFPGQEINADQVLALRRVALARRILELQSADPAGAELASYMRVAREIGLAGEDSRLIDAEETRLAQATLDSHPPAPVPTAPARPNQTQILQGILAYGTAHG